MDFESEQNGSLCLLTSERLINSTRNEWDVGSVFFLLPVVVVVVVVVYRSSFRYDATCFDAASG